AEEVERALAEVGGDRHGGRGHHHHPERGQGHGDRHQPAVVAAADRVQAGGLAGAVEHARVCGHGHQRTFNVARPTSTRITEMIQKRTITHGSGQPLSSKWWWMGAIRNTRLPVSLNDATWIISDRVSMTKMPPMITSTSSWRTITAMVPSTAPSASAPMSPMNPIAG